MRAWGLKAFVPWSLLPYNQPIRDFRLVGKMEDNFNQYRRSTRVTISIHIYISGVDADGNKFNESVRTQAVNMHGGKIATTHRLTMGTEILIENRTRGVVAKARVVWLGGKDDAEDLHLVALELLEPQNVWGMTFPPDDWSPRS
jgi:hypothetical protein